MYVRSHVFFFQAEDGIRDLVRSRGLGDVYKRQADTELVVVSADTDLLPAFKATAKCGSRIIHIGYELSLIHI